jgi:hypothetical protein
MSTLQHPRLANRPSAIDVLNAVLRSALTTVRLLIAGRLRMPKDLVGRSIHFADGSTSRVFRETSVSARRPTDPALLVVEFRLRWIGKARWAHRIFHHTCVVNTPLFAGFPGFVSKLWMCDADTGVYRGLYQWDGADRATAYAERLRLVLQLVCIDAAIAHHVEPGVLRGDALMGAAPGPSSGPDAWWRPTHAGVTTS